MRFNTPEIIPADIINELIKMGNPLECIVLNKKLSLKEKYFICTDILNEAINNELQITSMTISILLQNKSVDRWFYKLYYDIEDYCYRHRIYPYNYTHLYYLVLQLWLDASTDTISLIDRKELIEISFPDGFTEEIFNQITKDKYMWFGNIGRNKDVTELIDWMCKYDRTGTLIDLKESYERDIEECKFENKKIIKQYNASLEEYTLNQKAAKKNGLCKYTRTNQVCPHGFICRFYHGKNKINKQLCRFGINCKNIDNHNCKFLHEENS